MERPSQAERIAFWEHSYARASFVQARLYLELLLSADPPLDSLFRRALTISILAVYCRPFKQRSKVRLSEDTVPSEHRKTHDIMIELRDKVVAHRDLDGPVTEWGFVSQLQVNLRSQSLTVDTISPTMPNEKARETLPLIDHLIAEMDRKVDAFFAKYLTQLPPDDASYVVSLDESPTDWLVRTS
jgi:hypothetical protein